MKKIVVFASGSGSNFQTIVDKLHQKTCEVALLVCDKAGAYCLERAEKLHIPTFVFNPKEYETIISNQNVFLLTDGSKITMPNMKGWTKKDVTAFWEMTHIEVQMSGTGKVTSQNIKAGKAINSDTVIKVEME